MVGAAHHETEGRQGKAPTNGRLPFRRETVAHPDLISRWRVKAGRLDVQLRADLLHELSVAGS